MDVHRDRDSGTLGGVTSSSSSDPRLASAVLDALPLPMLVVDAALRVVHANAAARSALGAAAGTPLGEALGCAEGGGPCGAGARCAACAIREAATRALAGESVRARGFLLRSGAGGEPADLHVLASASPVDLGDGRHAVLVLEDADRILLDPDVVRICAGCGKVEDDEGGWHPLHRYLEDRLGLALEELCDTCARPDRGP
jgi:PAS domain-containing protein